MTRTEALRKLLAIGDLCLPEIEQTMGGDSLDVHDALFDLRRAGEIKVVRDGRQQSYYRLTDTAKATAFGVAHA